ncbi:hypothetical protein ABLE91_08800 [Aquabacter sp. CN5-332]|uniref:hypothetical protein n=1 Tax=Aquabacter sp. CN5-332 TaxID=3156608 RepID=UPI0032B3DB17
MATFSSVIELFSTPVLAVARGRAPEKQSSEQDVKIVTIGPEVNVLRASEAA